jgi:hypothetical protein
VRLRPARKVLGQTRSAPATRRLTASSGRESAGSAWSPDHDKAFAAAGAVMDPIEIRTQRLGNIVTHKRMVPGHGQIDP